MKAMKIVIAILALLAPIAARGLWYYQGVYRPAEPVQIPDYASMAMPVPDLSTPVAPVSKQMDVAPVVVFDQYHANQITLAEMEPFTRALSGLGARPEVYAGETSLGDLLKHASAFVVIAPTIFFTSDESRAVKDFVDRGGRLLVISDPTRMADPYAYYSSTYVTSVDIANLLLAPWGISYSGDYVYNLVDNEGNFRNIKVTVSGKNDITDGIKQLVLYSAQSIKTGEVLLQGDANTFSSLTDAGGGLQLAVTAADGNVLAMGDFSFLTMPYLQVADNQVLMGNLAAYLTSSTLTRDLKVFPYLFDRDVTLLVSPADEVDAGLLAEETETTVPLRDTDMLRAITSIQDGLRYIDVSVQFADAPVDGADLVILGTYPPSEVVQPYIKSFGIEFSAVEDLAIEETPVPTEEVTAEPDLAVTPTPFFDFGVGGGFNSPEEGDTMTLPGFGKLPTSGVGLILYTTSGDRNTLVLLAADNTALNDLAGFISSGSLATCAVQGSIAVCPVSESSSDDFGFGG